MVTSLGSAICCLWSQLLCLRTDTIIVGHMNRFCYSTVQYMKACGGRGSAPNPAGKITAPSRVQIPHNTHKFTQQAWRAKML